MEFKGEIVDWNQKESYLQHIRVEKRGEKTLPHLTNQWTMKIISRPKAWYEVIIGPTLFVPLEALAFVYMLRHSIRRLIKEEQYTLTEELNDIMDMCRFFLELGESAKVLSATNADPAYS